MNSWGKAFKTTQESPDEHAVTSPLHYILLSPDLIFGVFLPQIALLIAIHRLDASPILGYPVLILKTTKELKYKDHHLFGVSSKGPIPIWPIATLSFTSLY